MKTKTTKAATLRVLQGNIIEINYFNDNYVDVSEMKEIIYSISHLAENNKISILHLIGEYTLISMDAKLFHVSYALKKREQINAEAIVVKSIQTRLLEKFYCSKLKNQHQVKLFSNLISAKTWIKEISYDNHLKKAGPSSFNFTPSSN